MRAGRVTFKPLFENNKSSGVEITDECLSQSQKLS